MQYTIGPFLNSIISFPPDTLVFMSWGKLLCLVFDMLNGMLKSEKKKSQEKPINKKFQIFCLKK